VEAFHASGGRIAIFDTNEAAGSAMAAQLGERALFVQVNVVDEASVRDGIRVTLERFGALHIWINYAGITKTARTYGRGGVFPLADFNQVIQVNLVGTFNVLRLAAERMAQNAPVDMERGVIINTASVATYEGQIGQAAHSASKGESLA
jgi:NAD(P)-dependent dehydrogenase (short-subunit alcohol dehydrogenase family)